MPAEVSATATAPPPAFAARATSVEGSPVREILALTERPGIISLAGGLPAPELFDTEGLRAAYDTAFAVSARRALQYSTTEGAPELREAVAARATARGLPTGPDDVLVTSGSQQALTLITATLVEPGDVVLVENPTYLAALQCFRLAGARVVAVPCDAEGILPDALADIRAPAALRLAAVVAKQSADLHTSTVDQLAAAHYLRTVDLDAHTATVRTAYRERRDALQNALSRDLPADCEWNLPAGGMFFWARLPEGHDATALLGTALAHGVAFVPGAPFFAADPDPRTLRLNFTTHTPDEITEGVGRLAAALAEYGVKRLQDFSAGGRP
ncbi:PLP-dependent aminotransferase family protein [Streptomyces avidinii]|uniref:aminotransferase-like domain-containing protein n=1 Tax=Streptomyces avidinii TaxID=1895 RepID=UPI003864DAEF